MSPAVSALLQQTHYAYSPNKALKRETLGVATPIQASSHHQRPTAAEPSPPSPASPSFLSYLTTPAVDPDQGSQGVEESSVCSPLRGAHQMDEVDLTVEYAQPMLDLDLENEEEEGEEMMKDRSDQGVDENKQRAPLSSPGQYGRIDMLVQLSKKSKRVRVKTPPKTSDRVLRSRVSLSTRKTPKKTKDRRKSAPSKKVSPIQVTPVRRSLRNGGDRTPIDLSTPNRILFTPNHHLPNFADYLKPKVNSLMHQD
jgi:hypothetical protein